MHRRAGRARLIYLTSLDLAGADLSFAGKGGLLPLVHSAAINRVDLVEYLLDRGVPIDSADPAQRLSALLAATRNNLLPMVQFLLQRGAQVDQRDALGLTPLHHASVQDCSLVNVLIAAGADIEASSVEGRRPLHLAAQFGQS